MEYSVIRGILVLCIATSVYSIKTIDLIRNYNIAHNVESKTSNSLKDLLHLSLFPNIPPFIKFSVNVTVNIPDEIKKDLIWRRAQQLAADGFLINYVVTKTGLLPVNKTRDKENEWFGYWHYDWVTRIPIPNTFQRPYQKLNLFSGLEELDIKDRQCGHMKRVIQKFGGKEYGFNFESYVLPEDADEFKRAWAKHENKIWIVKPPLGDCSRGIRMIDHWNQIGSDESRTLVQKYLHNPLLLSGRKFEIRTYVLITSFNPLRIYVNSNGCTKIGYANFTLDTMSPCAHIRVPNADTQCPGSQNDPLGFHSAKFYWLNSKTFDYLKKENSSINIEKIEEDIHEAIVKSLLAIEPIVSRNSEKAFFNRYNAYQMVSFDFLVDENLKVWLIEINQGPDLKVETDTDVQFEIPMMEEILNLAGFHFPPNLSQDAKQILQDTLQTSNSDPTFEERLYSFALSPSEIEKQSKYINWNSNLNNSLTDLENCQCAEEILTNLTPDDVRQLVIAEDELNRSNQFKRIFPTKSGNGIRKYVRFMESNPYYALLYEAWECRYSKNRQEGINLLRGLTSQDFHLQF